ncbi:MAG: 3-oxoacyl-ACP synthase [Pedobacter sp.]|nr:MAG: 3-oxoacyl-ACP synthase [Pedobacter sp.]
MTGSDIKELRSRLYLLCNEFVEMRIQTAQTALQQAQEAANDDTKSSAGDKFETTREMMQQELDRNKRLLFDAQMQQNLLRKIESATTSDTVKHGSIIHTSEGSFFLSISAGQIMANGKGYMAISPASPIGNLFLGKLTGAAFEFNGRNYKILEVY